MSKLKELSPDILSEIFRRVSSYPVAKRVSKSIEKMYSDYPGSFVTKDDLMKKYPDTFNIPIYSILDALELDFNTACVNGDFEAVETLMNAAIERIATDTTFVIDDIDKADETKRAVILAIRFLHFFGKKKHVLHIVESNRDILLDINPGKQSGYLVNRYLYPDVYDEPKDTEIKFLLGYANYPSEIMKINIAEMNDKPIYVDISTYRNLTDEICVNISMNDDLVPTRAIDVIKDSKKEDVFISKISMERVITNNMIEATKELSLHYTARTGEMIKLPHKKGMSQYFIDFVAPGFVDVKQA